MTLVNMNTKKVNKLALKNRISSSDEKYNSDDASIKSEDESVSEINESDNVSIKSEDDTSASEINELENETDDISIKSEDDESASETNELETDDVSIKSEDDESASESNETNDVSKKSEDDEAASETSERDDASEGSEDDTSPEINKVGKVVVENETESENEPDSDANEADTNLAWVDSISKILKTNRPKGKKSLVLSKAKKLTDVREKPEDIGFQIDGEIKEEKPDTTKIEIKEETDEPPRKKQKELPKIRRKPNILEKDRERTLSKIATRGVVQLFNAVRMQQYKIETDVENAGALERKRENALKNIDKRQFLDVLMQKKSQPVDNDVNDEIVQKTETGGSAKSMWGVLKDDFMMGAKLKDWDKEIEENENDDIEISDLSDSD